MKERPILFNGAMVRALLAGQKTQTRRVLKQATGPSLSVGCEDGVAELSWLHGAGPGCDVEETVKQVPCPYGQPGDRLWVRESWQLHGLATDLATVVYAASKNQSWTEMHRLFPAELAAGMTPKPFQHGWRPSIHMPRWASRILLEIVSVRVERLQDIREADALAEGVKSCEAELDTCGYWYSPEELYSMLWTKINGWGDSGWNANPYVWVVEFRRVEP